MKQAPVERYSYDADGGRVRKESQTEVTRVIGPHYEAVIAVASGQVLTTTKYYAFGGQRIAVRQNRTLSYLHSDHLGSTVCPHQQQRREHQRRVLHRLRRSACGGNVLNLPTDHTFTGQTLDRQTGLLYYGARFYSPAIARFLSPDTIVPSPGDPQSLNRYSYTGNNPVRYVDPDGHWPNIPSVNGSLGLTGLSSADTLTFQHPAVQPLTLSMPNDRPAISAGVAPRPDDGLLLQYYNPGYANRREELAVTTPDVPFGVGSVQAQVRQVTLYSSLLGNDISDAYVENALSGSVGVYKVVEVGAESHPAQVGVVRA